MEGMDKLTLVFRDLFDRPDLEIEGLTRSNFAPWDSLAHVKLIIALEEEFGFKFTVEQVANLRSVEELKRVLGVEQAVT